MLKFSLLGIKVVRVCHTRFLICLFIVECATHTSANKKFVEQLSLPFSSPPPIISPVGGIKIYSLITQQATKTHGKYNEEGCERNISYQKYMTFKFENWIFLAWLKMCLNITVSRKQEAQGGDPVDISFPRIKVNRTLVTSFLL